MVIQENGKFDYDSIEDVEINGLKTFSMYIGKGEDKGTSKVLY